MDLVWFRSSFAWSLLGKLSRAGDVAMFVAVTDDDRGKRVVAAAMGVTVPFGVFR
jgi:hypothetical protein